MRYFVNINTAEELKQAYRDYCLRLHPDCGGSEEEFKAMMAEYETMLKAGLKSAESYAEEARERARQEEEQRRQEEEWERERQEREREEEERKQKAREAMAATIKKWSKVLERIEATAHKRTYGFNDKKEAAAYVAAVKRNVKAVFNHYFPGVKCKVNISGRIWQEKFELEWEDGPTELEVQAIEELNYFVPSHYESDPFADYGHYVENASTAPWREVYGQALGDATSIDLIRTVSADGKAQVEATLAQYFSRYLEMDTDRGRGLFTATLSEFMAFRDEACGMNNDNYRTLTWYNYANNERREDGVEYGDIYYSIIRSEARKYVKYVVEPKEEVPQFQPKYGETYKAIKKALGSNVFYEDKGDSRENRVLSIFEAAELLAEGVTVKLGHTSTNYDDETVVYGTDRGGMKVQQKRKAKFEEVGILVEEPHWKQYRAVEFVGIKDETLSALRKEAEDVERQRKEWETSLEGKKEEVRCESVKAETSETSETVETAPQGDGAITVHPYTTKKGKAAMYLAGFKDMKDPRYAELAEHNVKPCYIRNEDGSRTYVAYFGARYGEGARLFAEALTTGNAETLAKAHEAMKQAHPYYGKDAA